MARPIKALEEARRIAVAQVPGPSASTGSRRSGSPTCTRRRSTTASATAPGDRCLLSGQARVAARQRRRRDQGHRVLLQLSCRGARRARGAVAAQHRAHVCRHLSGQRASRAPDSAGRVRIQRGRRTLRRRRAAAGLRPVLDVSGGVIVDDFDKDGRLDIVTSSIDSCAPLRLFHRNDDGTFTDRAAQAGLATQLGGLNIVQTDYNNDGNLDILVLRGGWETPQRKSLLRNNGDGTFTDVTVASGLAKRQPARRRRSGRTSTTTGSWTSSSATRTARPSSFATTATARSTTSPRRRASPGADSTRALRRPTTTTTAGPTCMSRILAGRTSSTGTIATGRSRSLGAAPALRDQGRAFRPGSSTTTTTASRTSSSDRSSRPSTKPPAPICELPRNGNTLKLYRNLGDGSFQDVTRQAGLDKVLMVMGANFGDIDNDGFLDIYLGTGNPSYASLVPSLLLRNKAGSHSST